ncbi:uncharacterized protein LOC132488211 [Mesoplodon densirostris]|uniref:uncharacterized protein LOC132488211 n=1 Tax=Mesoplodon densirostris TaxID=48708 RepID=UPI0028DB3E81|nr:uncharacterized protein LOC132488211 [Mesoplodon densirostris]
MYLSPAQWEVGDQAEDAEVGEAQPPGSCAGETGKCATLHTRICCDGDTCTGDENDDLYCRTCRQFFSSLHNKREHLLGKQHLQNLTGEFEKDSAECLKHLEPLEGEVGQNLNKGDSEEEAECPDPLPLRGLIPETSFASLDLRFLQEFIFKLLKIKEFEFRELRKTLERAQAEQEALQRQLLEFQNRQQRLEVELAGLKTYGVVLEKEFENLNMVLMLSHFGLRHKAVPTPAPMETQDAFWTHGSQLPKIHYPQWRRSGRSWGPVDGTARTALLTQEKINCAW